MRRRQDKLCSVRSGDTTTARSQPLAVRNSSSMTPSATCHASSSSAKAVRPVRARALLVCLFAISPPLRQTLFLSQVDDLEQL